MGLKSFKPITPGRRDYTVSDFAEITESKPLKALIKGLTKKGGRNNKGRITARRRGGGHKRKYREIDFKRNKDGVPGKIDSIQYDPNRSARIALINYADGDKRYILATTNMKVGDEILSGNEADILDGNCLKLKDIPLGAVIHNIEMKPGKGAQVARSAGTGAQLLAKEGKYVHVKLPSGEIRLINAECKASIGQVGNMDHSNISLGKAGRKRWQGKRPRVRAMVMNPVDHPMGGGEGCSKSNQHPCSPNGIPAKGFKTRSKKKYSDKHIVSRPKKRR